MGHHIRVTAIRRDEPDLTRLVAALLLLVEHQQRQEGEQAVEPGGQASPSEPEVGATAEESAA